MVFARNREETLLALPISSSKELFERIHKQVFELMGTAPLPNDATMLAIQRMVLGFDNRIRANECEQ